jgi:hypothetical protein
MSQKQFTYKINSEIDRKKWDETISMAENGTIYALSAYLDIVSPDWSAFIAGDYETVFPLPVKQRTGVLYVMHPIFNQQLGLFSQKSATEADWKIVLRALKKKFSLALLNISLVQPEIVKDAGFRYFVHNNYVLDMSSEYGQIRSGYSTNLKRNLQKADGYDPEIRKSNDSGLLIQLFKENKGQEIPFLNDQRYLILNRLITQMCAHELGKIEFVYHENEAVAGIFWAEWKNTSVFLFSAVSEKGKQLNAMPFLIDNYIIRNAGKIKRIDFEGSDNESIARFYRGFGAELYQYITIETEFMAFIRKIKKHL